MADTTPQPPAPEEGEGVAKPATPKKVPARKSAAKASAPAAQSEQSTPAETEVVATPDPEPGPADPDSAVHAAPNAAPTPAHQPVEPSHRDRSILDRVRENPVGPLAAGLFVAIAVGLLLSVLVPDDPTSLAMLLLGTLLSAAVGFTVRYLSNMRGLRRQVEGFLTAAIGVHLMAVTGAVGGDIPGLSQLGFSGPGFDEALIIAFAIPPVSTGAVVSGLAAAIIVGWGRTRESASHR